MARLLYAVKAQAKWPKMDLKYSKEDIDLAWNFGLDVLAPAHADLEQDEADARSCAQSKREALIANLASNVAGGAAPDGEVNEDEFFAAEDAAEQAHAGLPAPSTKITTLRAALEKRKLDATITAALNPKVAPDPAT